MRCKFTAVFYAHAHSHAYSHLGSISRVNLPTSRFSERRRKPWNQEGSYMKLRRGEYLKGNRNSTQTGLGTLKLWDHNTTCYSTALHYYTCVIDCFTAAFNIVGHSWDKFLCKLSFPPHPAFFPFYIKLIGNIRHAELLWSCKAFTLSCVEKRKFSLIQSTDSVHSLQDFGILQQHKLMWNMSTAIIIHLKVKRE